MTGEWHPWQLWTREPLLTWDHGRTVLILILIKLGFSHLDQSYKCCLQSQTWVSQKKSEISSMSDKWSMYQNHDSDILQPCMGFTWDHATGSVLSEMLLTNRQTNPTENSSSMAEIINKKKGALKPRPQPRLPWVKNDLCIQTMIQIHSKLQWVLPCTMLHLSNNINIRSVCCWNTHKHAVLLAKLHPPPSCLKLSQAFLQMKPNHAFTLSNREAAHNYPICQITRVNNNNHPWDLLCHWPIQSNWDLITSYFPSYCYPGIKIRHLVSDHPADRCIDTITLALIITLHLSHSLVY